MVYKIALREGFRNHIEELRALHGDYNKEVFFWDCVLKERFDVEEHALEYVKRTLDDFDLENIKIVEVSL
jgi:hypothetical protein